MAVPNSIRCQFIANLSPMRCQSDQSVSNQVQIRRQSSINQMPNQCQSIANLRPIRTQAMAIQFRSTADPIADCQFDVDQDPFNPNQVSIQLQSSTNPSQHDVSHFPIQGQSDVNPAPIRCQSSVNSFQSDANPMSIQCQSCKSIANLTPTQRKSGINKMLIQCSPESNVNQVPIHPNPVSISYRSNANPSQFGADPMQIQRLSHADPAPILSQSNTNPVPIYPNLMPIQC